MTVKLRRPQPATARLLVVGAVVVAIGVGLAAGRPGRRTAGTAVTSVTTATTRPPVVPSLPAYSPVSDRSKVGATASAVLFIQRLNRLWTLDPAAVTADWSAALRAQVPDVGANVSALGFTARTVILGSNLVSYSADVAVVSVWTMSVVASPQAQLQVQAVWTTSTPRVVWEAGRWLLDGHANPDQSGPTPPTAAVPSTPTEIRSALQSSQEAS